MLLGVDNPEIGDEIEKRSIVRVAEAFDVVVAGGAYGGAVKEAGEVALRVHVEHSFAEPRVGGLRPGGVRAGEVAEPPPEPAVSGWKTTDLAGGHDA